MSLWEYEIDNRVTSGVSGDGIRRLIGNGTLRSGSHIQQVGSDNWTTVEQSEFGVLLPGVQAAKVDALASAVQPVGEKLLLYCAVGFALIVIVGVLMSLAGSRATSLGDALVQNTATLRYVNILLICAIIAVFVSARAIIGQLRSQAEYARAAEVMKLHEIQKIRQSLEARSTLST